MNTLVHTPFGDTFIDVNTGKVILIHIDSYHLQNDKGEKISYTMYSLEEALESIKE